MKLRLGIVRHLLCLIASLFAFGTWQSHANNTEVDWTFTGFSTSHITINAGDKVDIVNYDYDFGLYVTGAPPEGFTADVPASDGYYVWYVPYVYYNPGTFSFSDEFGNTVTVTVNAVQPLSVAITAPTNNAVFTAPATFTVTAVPAGGATPYFEVDFYVGTNWAGVAYDPPFTNPVTNLPVGNYNISAVVTDDNFDTATDSVLVSVGGTVVTNYILPADCATIYSSGSVLRITGLTLSASTQGGLEFAAFNASQYSSILLELNPSSLPMFDSTVDVYGFDGGTGTLTGSDYNSGTFIGTATFPPNPAYGQITTFDVTAFVKSIKQPYFGFILHAVGDVLSSTTVNYGTPPELYVIGPPPPSRLTASRAGNQIIISWPTNYADGLSLHSSATLGAGASWNVVSPMRALVGNQWVVTNSISGPRQFYRLSTP